MQLHEYSFRMAQPVWETGTAHTMNRTVSFCTDIPLSDLPAGQQIRLAAAASCSFVLLVNGQFVAHGPARCAHGFFRVDEYDLTPYLTAQVNRVCLRTAGYNVNSFSYLNQPSFLCAEITAGEQVLAATGAGNARDFIAYGVGERIRRVQRYSFQRTMVESYDLRPGAFSYESDPHTAAVPVATGTAEAGRFLYRDMPYSDNEILRPLRVIRTGHMRYSDKASYYDSREISAISDHFFGYRPDELDCASHIEVGRIDYDAGEETALPADVIPLPADGWADLDMGRNYTGVWALDIEAAGDGILYLTFDEVIHGTLNPFRMGTSNIIRIGVNAGRYRLTTAEPYVMRYLRLSAKGCAITVRDLRLYHIAFPATHITARFAGQDDAMHRIFDAAVETFRANTVDIYMDCPSRERAGWLCDSFFTSRVERVLTGRSDVERAFLQNFLLPEHFAFLPDGMLPMCYPSDHNDRTFIPNWAMWYGVEMGEYLTRTGDRAFTDSARERLYALLAYFAPFENEYGLLEGLKSWVFVEWSKSNELVQDVSFASNMLYARLLDTCGQLYGDSDLTGKAAKLRATILDMSMTESGFFCDNALRQDGKLVLSGERTESCQYYAFFCDIVTPESHPWLWETLLHDFGYDRATRGLYPEIYPANAFIGNYLRLDLLDRYGCREALYDNIKGYFTYMADKTGTLWENVGDYASCNHGFASHVLYWMDHLGLLTRDIPGKDTSAGGAV